jgi:glutamate synthase (NADPH/NADH) large chain
VIQGLRILENIDHRGAVGADPLMGDGAGLLIQIPDEFYRAEMARQGVTLPPPGEYGVGMVFLPKEAASRQACVHELERAIRTEGQVLLGWRDVPVDHGMPMSPAVRALEPVIRQVFIGRGADILVPDALERKLYVIRKTASAKITSLDLTHGFEYYVPSMSCRTVVYKGLLLADQVGKYYLDLQDERLVSAMALVHSAVFDQHIPDLGPLRIPVATLAHNGEINTLQGQFQLDACFREGVDELAEVLACPSEETLSDHRWRAQLGLRRSSTTCSSCCIMAGRPLDSRHDDDDSRSLGAARTDGRASACVLRIPRLDAGAVGWSGGDGVHRWPPDRRHAGSQRTAPGALRRHRRRPGGACLEAGVLPIPEGRIVRKWRLQPGRMFFIDFEQGRIIEDEELKNLLASAKPYRQWIENVRIRLDSIDARAEPMLFRESLLDRQQAFGYTREDVALLLTPMATGGEEGIGSMGNDAPLAVLSARSKPLYSYFRQLFAQVTNPPIDPIREAVVMSLVSFIGPRPNLLDINAVNPPMRLEVTQPVLDFADMARLRSIEKHTGGKFRSCEIDISYPASWGKEGVEARIAYLRSEAEETIRAGCNILILTDRHMDRDHVAIPALLALAAIHHHLVRIGLRTAAGLVVETATAREVHHFAVLAGYGAEAVHPWLAMETLSDLAPRLGLAPEKALANFTKAIGKGLSKIMSKMGISTYMSYCGAQIFEAIGLSQSLVEAYFNGTPSRVGGIGIFEVAEEALRSHHQAFGNDPVLANMLDAGGEYAWRSRGEEHMWTPDAIAKLQHGTRSNRYETFEEYAQIINDQSRRHMTLRGLFELRIDPARSIPLEDVEPAAEIVKRFATGAMSLGSISTEAHTNLAIAMNRIGGKSNTGEGGEDPARYRAELRGEAIRDGTKLRDVIGDVVEVDYTLAEGDSLRSRIKQVASGRFGVTTGYLMSADQIQIKMAQGAKPGEGGQLPGEKVSEYIGRLRHSVPGVGLISPPPHHDIYSIEDLAQLIHDLKNVNPRADVSVKLVSEVGVGTVAAGVAKAKADHIVIAGHDGGTGASPWSSIQHAGTPWELGLAETQQTLVLNRLRGRVRVQADGQMKTGRDVVIAALLGADEFGFATAPLVVSGCIMMRKCHLNTCPVGVATQDPVLRSRFSGKPEHVVNFFFFVAEEARRIMAQLGICRFDDLIGRADLLDTRQGIEHWKAKGLDFSRIFARSPVPAEVPRLHVETQDHGLDKALDVRLISQARAALHGGERVRFIERVRNVNRTVGAMLSGELIRLHPDGLPDDSIRIRFEGAGGQSFGAFLARGITFCLVGEANDYTGKGLSGGRIVVRPHDEFRGDAVRNIIVGNTVLYGATAGEAFFRGVAGERFGVRLSGATAVVEGTGDHGCEYMTGGTVVVLGRTGRNFAAGMSGGVAFVYDEDGDFARRCNTAQVALDPLLTPQAQQIAGIARHTGEADEVLLVRLLEDHHRWTGSMRARAILDHWSVERTKFIKVFPHEYRRALLGSDSSGNAGDTTTRARA